MRRLAKFIHVDKRGIIHFIRHDKYISMRFEQKVVVIVVVL